MLVNACWRKQYAQWYSESSQTEIKHEICLKTPVQCNPEDEGINLPPTPYFGKYVLL